MNNFSFSHVPLLNTKENKAGERQGYRSSNIRQDVPYLHQCNTDTRYVNALPELDLHPKVETEVEKNGVGNSGEALIRVILQLFPFPFS